jgi:hypothetical protein
MESPFTINQPIELPPNSNMGIQKQCSELNGKFYYIELKHTLNDCLAERIRMLQNEEIVSASNGVYVWIIAKLPNGDDFGFFAIKTLTVHEISTKHTQLIFRIKEKYGICDNLIIHGAGEFIKSNSKIDVNFLSGSYMADIISSMTPEQKTQVQQEISDAILEKTENKLGLDISIFSPPNDTFITNENLQFNYEDFILFIECGATITEYNTKKHCIDNTIGYQQTCDRAKSQYNMNLRSYEKGVLKNHPGEFVNPEPPAEKGIMLTVDIIRSRISDNEETIRSRIADNEETIRSRISDNEETTEEFRDSPKTKRMRLKNGGKSKSKTKRRSKTLKSKKTKKTK